MQVYETKITEHSGLKYKIEMRNNDGVWQQRHIWYPAPETYVTEETADAWIRSPTGLNDTFAAVPVAKVSQTAAPAFSRRGTGY